MNPFYIKSKSGNIFALYHAPDDQLDFKRNILFIPPFAEELNRSRHMINRQARDFAKAGYGVLILDLFGTGDSEGTFGEATIDIWQKDILAAIEWLKGTSEKSPIIWAMRSGALIAADLVQQKPGLTDQMILWSPIGNGKKFINQHLRIKLAAGMTGKPEDSALTLKDLWAKLESGQHLEIAGYDLSPALAHSLTRLSLDQIKLPHDMSVKWIEISLGSPANLSPASQKIIHLWQENNIAVMTASVNDPAFWALQEPEWAYDYIDQTMHLLEQ